MTTQSAPLKPADRVLLVSLAFSSGIRAWRIARDYGELVGLGEEQIETRLERLVDQNFVEPAGRFGGWRFTSTGFARALDCATPENIAKLQALRAADTFDSFGSWERCHFAALLSAAKFRCGCEDWRLSERDAKTLDWESYGRSGPGRFFVLILERNEEWAPFAEALPLAYAQSFFAGVRRFFALNPDAAVTNAARRYLEKRLGAEAKAVFAFYLDWLSEGRPAACAEGLPADSVHGLALRAAASIEADEAPGEASALMLKALLAAGKKRVFEDEPLLDWLLMIALYRDRENPACQKRLQQIAGTKKIRQDLSRAWLWLFAAVGCDEDAKSMTASYARKLWDANAWECSAEPLERVLFAIAATNFRLLPAGGLDLSSFERTAGRFNRHCALLALEWAHQQGFPEALENFRKTFGNFQGRPLMPAYQEKAKWDRLLDMLIARESVKKPKAAQKKAASEGPAVRILYLLSRSCELTLKLQKARAGGWTKGSDLSYAAFAKGVEGMSAQDRAAAGALYHPFGYISRYAIDTAQALEALAGSPNVCHAEPPCERIEVEKRPLEITVRRTGAGFEFETNAGSGYDPRLSERSWRFVDDNHIIVVHPTPEERELLIALDDVPAFPEAAQSKLTKYLELLSRSTPVRSDLLKDSKTLAKAKGDAKIVFRIEPSGAGRFTAAALVHPIPDAPLSCEPGRGAQFLAANLRGEPVQVERDLALERANFKAMEAALEPLDQCRTEALRWDLGLQDCLELLEALRERADIAAAEWPDGAKLVVKLPRLSSSSLSLALRRMGSWFEVEGKVRLSAKAVLTVAELLEKIRSAEGGFIRLGDKEYVALTDGIRKQLSFLDGLASVDRKGCVKVSVFNAGALERLEEDGVKLDADESFRALAARIRDAQSFSPAVPAGLRAELRPYQAEGFEWLARLASWGAGALLADDMGLGKTLQTIALLLLRAPQGPALVAMPASVLYNWADELRRFAPGLHPVILNAEADRAAAVKDAGPGDVLLVTYGVMTAEIDALKARKWTTAVLDEAHAIKNRDTKMSKAAMQLASAARVLLTGTPIQNHLSELWNLFEFANPGFLGSFQDFAERFVIPVEKNRDREKQRLLKRLISPFILRRTKAEVLDELPEKTEITIRVELSPEERALYESLRKNASEGLEAGRINAIEALAELTKLRQAACHPALVDPKLPIPSSKTAAFLELADELMAGRHRALVFSQFTSHLALVRRALDERGVRYLYLDGSMASGARKKLVEEFQQGDAPLFLISLKAGGTGLNLTAADYVIHLDPWWNPAIEDQASDRAYRIGQENPVTIYRLIAENTIEEKILRLHESKKSLADALLEGADMSSRLSRDEILALLAS